MEQQTQVTTTGAAFPHITAKIEKGQRNTYAWTLSATVALAPGEDLDAAFDRAFDALGNADDAMRRMFGTVAEGTIKPAA